MFGKPFTLRQPSPSQQCYLELLRLSQLPEHMPIYRIGGSLTADEKTENARRRIALEEARIAAIIRHGVQDEYIKKAKAENQDRKAEMKAHLAKIRENDALVARLRESK